MCTLLCALVMYAVLILYLCLLGWALARSQSKELTSNRGHVAEVRELPDPGLAL